MRFYQSWMDSILDERKGFMLRCISMRWPLWCSWTFSFTGCLRLGSGSILIGFHMEKLGSQLLGLTDLMTALVWRAKEVETFFPWAKDKESIFISITILLWSGEAQEEVIREREEEDILEQTPLQKVTIDTVSVPALPSSWTPIEWIGICSNTNRGCWSIASSSSRWCQSPMLAQWSSSLRGTAISRTITFACKRGKGNHWFIYLVSLYMACDDEIHLLYFLIIFWGFGATKLDMI